MNDVIEALDRAVWLPHDEADAATIRQHIADLRAGKLVRQEDAVTLVQQQHAQWKDRERAARAEKRKFDARDFESMAIACVHIADAIERGEHLRGGE